MSATNTFQITFVGIGSMGFSLLSGVSSFRKGLYISPDYFTAQLKHSPSSNHPFAAKTGPRPRDDQDGGDNVQLGLMCSGSTPAKEGAGRWLRQHVPHDEDFDRNDKYMI